jgi:hypothetical protein
MRSLLIDDLRDIGADTIARTFDEGMSALQNQGPWDILYLDHDLGDPDTKKTGYNIVNWLERNPQYWPNAIQVVSSNPVGRQNIERVLTRYFTKVVHTWILNSEQDV